MGTREFVPRLSFFRWTSTCCFPGSAPQRSSPIHPLGAVQTPPLSVSLSLSLCLSLVQGAASQWHAPVQLPALSRFIDALPFAFSPSIPHRPESYEEGTLSIMYGPLALEMNDDNVAPGDRERERRN